MLAGVQGDEHGCECARAVVPACRGPDAWRAWVARTWRPAEQDVVGLHIRVHDAVAVLESQGHLAIEGRDRWWIGGWASIRVSAQARRHATALRSPLKPYTSPPGTRRRCYHPLLAAGGPPVRQAKDCFDLSPCSGRPSTTQNVHGSDGAHQQLVRHLPQLPHRLACWQLRRRRHPVQQPRV